MRIPVLLFGVLLASPAFSFEAADVIGGNIVERLAARSSATSEQASSAPVTTGGLVLRSGYDSNYDVLEEAVGSSFVEASTWREVSVREGDVEAFAGAEVYAIALPELEQALRFDSVIEGGLRRQFDKSAIEAAVSMELDGLEDPLLLDFESAIAASLVKQNAAIGLRGRFDLEHEETLGMPVSDLRPDQAKTYLEASLLLMPEAVFSPIVEVSTRQVTSLFEDDVSLTDDARNDEVYLGARLSPSSSFVARAGLRLSHRDAADPEIGPAFLATPEFKLDWDVAKDWRFRASVLSSLEAPELVDSVAAAVTDSDVDLAYSPAEGFGFKASAGYELTEELGAGAFSDKSEATLEASFRWWKYWLAEVAVSRQVERDVDGEIVTMDRLVISAGAEATF